MLLQPKKALLVGVPVRGQVTRVECVGTVCRTHRLGQQPHVQLLLWPWGADWEKRIPRLHFPLGRRSVVIIFLLKNVYGFSPPED